MNYAKSEEDAMSKCVKEIAEAGINVLVAQNAISEMAMHFLEVRILYCVQTHGDAENMVEFMPWFVNFRAHF